jgi:hypothetical protein
MSSKDKPLNSAAIHAALSRVHLIERTSANPNGLTRVKAVETVLRQGTGLSHREVDILLNALHVSRYEITVQF